VEIMIASEGHRKRKEQGDPDAVLWRKECQQKGISDIQVAKTQESKRNL
jgi:hypothetical protein